MPFDAFLSHSSRDRRAVQRLHRRIERYRPPRALGGKRRLRVYHYETDGELNPSLERALAAQLAAVEHFVLVASTHACQSSRVDFEIVSFLNSHPDSSKFHVVIVKGEPPSCYPDALPPALRDPAYADLRGADCHWLLWYARNRRRFNRVTLPLLARLLDVSPDALIQRERRRRRQQMLLAAAVLVLVSGLVVTQYLRAPSHAWIRATTSEDRPVSEAVLLTLPDGREAVRTLARWDEPVADDLPRNPSVVINEFDLTGLRTGEFRYHRDDAGTLPRGRGTRRIVPDGDRTLWGSLAAEAPTDATLRTHIPAIDRPRLMRGGSKARRCQPGELEDYMILAEVKPDVYCDDVEFLEANQTALKEQARKSAAPRQRLEEQWAIRAFALPGLLVAFAPLTDDYGLMYALPLTSRDQGATWAAGRVLDDHVVNDLRDPTFGGRDPIRMYAGFSSLDGNLKQANKVLRSDDGLSWSAVSLPPNLAEQDRWQLQDLVTSRTSPDLLAVTLFTATSGRPRRIVSLSRDTGRTWSSLDVDLPAAQGLVLAGMTDRGLVAGIFHENGTTDTPEVVNGRLFLWRPLSVRERLARAMSFR